MVFHNVDDFLCICATFGRTFGFWAQFLRFSTMHKYTKIGITRPSDCLYPWARFHLMWNLEFNTLDDLPCTSAHNLGYLGPVFLNCPNIPNCLTCECLTGITFWYEQSLSKPNYLLELKNVNYFFCIPDHDWFRTLGRQIFWIAQSINFSSSIF